MSDRETVNILKTCEKRNSYIEIIHNKTRNYRLKNIVDHASRQDPEDIICAVDSDDWLARKDALSIIKKTYDDDPKLEYVYSNYRLSSNDEPDYSAVKHIEDILYVYHFYGNPNMPRVGPVADERANLAVSSSTYIKQRGYIEE